MNANRRTIIGMTLPAIFAVFIATLAVAAHQPSTFEGTLYAAAPRLQLLEPDGIKPPLRPSSNVTPVRDLKAERAVSGSEPDPETFDKAGLESWWSKHRKAAK